LNIISASSSAENIFEIEDYFKRALNELGIKAPTIEISARAYIAFLASNILKVESLSEMFDLAYKIFQIVAELQYPEDLMEWYEISEMIEQIQYDDLPLEFNKENVKLKIEKEAKYILEVNK
jgi:hypothetical protein